MRMKLSFNVICQDEEELIHQCLSHLIKIGEAVDGGYEIVIVDGGSRDRTLEIIKEMVNGADPSPIRLLQKMWPGGFGEQRQFNMEMSRGEWIMMMDVDDILSDGIYARINDLLADRSRHVYCFPKIHLLHDIHHMLADAPKDPKRVIWRNLPDFRWSGSLESFTYQGVPVNQHPCHFNFPWVAYVPDIRLVHFEGLKSDQSLLSKFRERSKYERCKIYRWSDEQIQELVAKRKMARVCPVEERHPGLTFYHEIDKGLWYGAGKDFRRL